ncbi:MAG: citramalate synthase [Ruminococcus sp.]|jgi:2-isopropylmalate synthase|nr:citramalate synthase [Ruminococcus sp.]
MIEILDSTLRDGAQSENVSFSAADKKAVIKTLCDFGIPFIEAGNPGSNPKDSEIFSDFSEYDSREYDSSENYSSEYYSSENYSSEYYSPHYIDNLVAFGATRRKAMRCEDDKLFMSLIECPAKNVSIFGKASVFHATEILGASLEENLEMIEESISFAVRSGKVVFFDAEHFFDGYKDNPEYAKTVIFAAAKAGASRIVLCDTNGGSFPSEVYDITKSIKDALYDYPDVIIGIHCHNDCGFADASALFAVMAGASHVQGTFTGIGERCGNTNLSTIIPSIMLKLKLQCIPEENLPKLTETARKIAEIANIRLPDGMPFVGKSAFAHKGGMHADGVRKNPISFEHINPASVGNERNILLSEVAGRAAVIAKVSRIFTGKDIDKNSPEISDIITTVKEREADGYQYEGADASFEILVRERFGIMPEYFTLDYYKILGERTGEAEPLTSAIIKARVNDKTKLRVHEGDGPVNAIDKALRKALSQFYPVLETVHLSDYKVRIIDSKNATAANVRVLIESTDGVNVWTTVGASTNIINASVSALIDSIKYKLLLEEKTGG